MKFERNKIQLNTAGCQSEIKRFIDEKMTVCAEHMMRIMRRQIEDNGNGSWFMRNTAIAQVKEILHEVTDDHISIYGGIDEAALKGADEAVFVRTMVVLHGNQAGGKLTTKPGQETYGKHVVAKGESTAATKYSLPESWNMYDVTSGIMKNMYLEVQKYFKAMLAEISAGVPAIISGYLTGG